MSDDINLQTKIDTEVNKLIINEWGFLDQNWLIIQNKYSHRTENKDIDDIKKIKNELKDKLGFTTVFFFLHVLYTNKEYPGPHREIDKGLILLYHIVCGEPGSKMTRHMKYTTFYKLYKKFWMNDENYEYLYKKVNYCLKNMFSTPLLRLCTSMKINPKLVKHVTCYIDGHDSRINYVNTDIKREILYSYKLKTAGLRTQIIADTNEMIVNVSRSEFCSDASDGNMMLNMKIYRILNQTDCMACDGGYNLFIKKFEEICIEKSPNNIINDDNFVYPVRKEPGINLNKTESHFNDVFGSFRSGIENQFSVLGSKFKRFNNNTNATKIDNIKYYNLQFKVACLLKNTNKFVEKFNIIEQPHHKLWYNDNFEFPSKTKLIDIVILTDMELKEKTERLKNIQINLSNSMEDLQIIENNDYESDNGINNNCRRNDNNISSEDDVPKEYNKKKKKRKTRGKNRNKDIDIADFRILDSVVIEKYT
jgi:hypothetical protein